MRAEHARQIRTGVVMAQQVLKGLDEGFMLRYRMDEASDLTIDAYFATLNTAALKRGFRGSQVVNRRRRSHARRFR
jgi:hypothetical protein